METTNNFNGFVEGTKAQIDALSSKDENTYYIATDVELATLDDVDSAIATAITGALEVAY